MQDATDVVHQIPKPIVFLNWMTFLHVERIELKQMSKQQYTTPRTPWLITSNEHWFKKICPREKHHIPGTDSRNTNEHTESQMTKVN